MADNKEPSVKKMEHPQLNRKQISNDQPVNFNTNNYFATLTNVTNASDENLQQNTKTSSNICT